MDECIMDINRETAMLLWNKRYGKASKVKDFAGREMVKAAYDDRNSDYGWNLDHILPQSRGGKNTESNLVCCHILTNDEKADSFPCFNANGIRFEIRKVENHYEIQSVTENSDEETVNFMDSAAGIRFYKDLKGVQNKPVFVGTVIVELFGMNDTAVVDFVSEIFSGYSLTFDKSSGSSPLKGVGESFVITVKDFFMPTKDDIKGMLDLCVTLNTYLKDYFGRNGIISYYVLFFGVHTDDDKIKALLKRNWFATFRPVYATEMRNLSAVVENRLYINELVVCNTDAKNELKDQGPVYHDGLGYDVYDYDMVYTNLSKNLKKE